MASKINLIQTPLTAAMVILIGAGPVLAAAVKMQRSDFDVQGSSCATCLIRLEKKLKATPGVLKAVVSIYKPFHAAVIYDPQKTDWAKVSTVFTAEKVQAGNLKQSAIDEIPLVLEPR